MHVLGIFPFPWYTLNWPHTCCREMSSPGSVAGVVQVISVPLERTREVLAPQRTVPHLLEQFRSVNLYVHKPLHSLICVYLFFVKATEVGQQTLLINKDCSCVLCYFSFCYFSIAEWPLCVWHKYVLFLEGYLYIPQWTALARFWRGILPPYSSYYWIIPVYMAFTGFIHWEVLWW